jgi:hypothetical protein
MSAMDDKEEGEIVEGPPSIYLSRWADDDDRRNCVDPQGGVTHVTRHVRFTPIHSEGNESHQPVKSSECRASRKSILKKKHRGSH